MRQFREKILRKILIKFSEDISPFSVQPQDLIKTVFGREITDPIISHISLLPAECLISSNTLITLAKIHMSIDLGVAHLSGWIAYTVIDGILDEQQKTTLLPITLHLLRNMYGYLDSYGNKHSQKTIFKILADADLYYHHPVYSWKAADISRRSLGHAIPAILIASRNGYGGKEMRMIVDYFIHYLACRQLADDVKDWHEDFLETRVTSVTKLVEKSLAPEKIKKLRRGIINEDIHDEISSLIINRVSPLMISWTKRALRLLSQGPFRDSEYFKKQVLDLQNQAIRALESIK